MMSKYPKFGVDTLNTIWVMGYIKFLHDNDYDSNDLAISSWTFFETDKLKSDIVSLPVSLYHL